MQAPLGYSTRRECGPTSVFSVAEFNPDAGLCRGLRNVKCPLAHWGHRDMLAAPWPIVDGLSADAFSEIDEDASFLADGPSVVAWLDGHSIARADLGCVLVLHLDVQPACDDVANVP